jgi:hypothetical protein
MLFGVATCFVWVPLKRHIDIVLLVSKIGGRWVRIEKAVGKIKPPKRAKVEQENSIVR